MNIKKLFPLLGLAISSFGLIACGTNDADSSLSQNSSESIKYTIIFDSKGGSAVDSIVEEAGKKISAPANPTKEGFDFSGWYESNDNGITLNKVPFVFDLMPSRNITLYASWDVKSEEFSEVNKKYSVKSASEDVTFTWENPEDASSSDDEFKVLYSFMTVTFMEESRLEIYFHAGMDADKTHFYYVNENDELEFYNSKEDLQARQNKNTEDYFAFNYKFFENKKKLKVTFTVENDGGKILHIGIVLTASL